MDTPRNTPPLDRNKTLRLWDFGTTDRRQAESDRRVPVRRGERRLGDRRTPSSLRRI